MTDNQWKAFIANQPKPFNHKETWYREHQAREMINSYLAYNCRGEKVAINVLNYAYGERHNYLAPYIEDLGEKRILELIQEQIDDIECVMVDVFTDDEFVHYNAIVWKDDDEETRKRKGM